MHVDKNKQAGSPDGNVSSGGMAGRSKKSGGKRDGQSLCLLMLDHRINLVLCSLFHLLLPKNSWIESEGAWVTKIRDNHKIVKKDKAF